MPERKKSVVTKGPETPGAVANPLAEATGARDPEVAGAGFTDKVQHLR